MVAKDYESIDDTGDAYADGDTNGDHFPSMLMKLCGAINIKVAIFLFIIGLFIFSDVFVRGVLSGFSNSVSNINCTTTHGTIIQLVFLVLGYIFIDLLVQGKYI